MYRLVALARARRRADVDPQPRRPRSRSSSAARATKGPQVGIAWALEKGHDWIAPFYRSIATCLTFGMSARDIMTAQYATADDPSSGGRQMPGHYGSHEHNIVSSSSPVATQLLHAVGIALAAKIRKTGQVAMTSMGEGSSNQGDVHEGLNFAGDPQAAVRLRRREQRLRHQRAGRACRSRCRDVADRAAGYGIPGVVVDGGDVLACYAAARDAVARARAGEGPTLIEAKVTRLTAHSSDDQQTKYRSEDELTAERGRDPLPHFRDQLRDAGVLTEAIEARAGRRDRGRRRRRDRVRRGAAGPRPGDRRPATSTPRTSTDAGPDVHRGDPRDASPTRCAATSRSSSWARTSARRAASSSPPTGCGPSSATSA